MWLNCSARCTAATTLVALAAPIVTLAHAQAAAAASAMAPRADSAQRARAAFRLAMAAYAQHDLASARREMLRAAEV